MAVRQPSKHGLGVDRVTIRAVASIEEHKNGRYSIIITEVPYGMRARREAFVDKVRTLSRQKKITHCRCA